VSKRGWALFAAISVIWGMPYLLIKIAVGGGPVPVLMLARVADREPQAGRRAVGGGQRRLAVARGRSVRATGRAGLALVGTRSPQLRQDSNAHFFFFFDRGFLFRRRYWFTATCCPPDRYPIAHWSQFSAEPIQQPVEIARSPGSSVRSSDAWSWLQHVLSYVVC
jgi:hypothetical protein